jgi:uncharacterized membrane protein YadS
MGMSYIVGRVSYSIWIVFLSSTRVVMSMCIWIVLFVIVVFLMVGVIIGMSMTYVYTIGVGTSLCGM